MQDDSRSVGITCLVWSLLTISLRLLLALARTVAWHATALLGLGFHHQEGIVRIERHLCDLAPADNISEVGARLGQEVRQHPSKAELLLCDRGRPQPDAHQALIAFGWCGHVGQTASFPGPCSNLQDKTVSQAGYRLIG